jgi:hypothetical protein
VNSVRHKPLICNERLTMIRRDPMAITLSTEIQAKLLREFMEANTKRRRLEEAIKSRDAASKEFIDNAALRVIEIYRSRSIPKT